MSSIERAVVTPEPLDLVDHISCVSADTAGAVATFLGQVRDHDAEAPGRVTGLDYSAHPDAGAILVAVTQEVLDAADVDDVRVAVSHRVGSLAVGDAAIVVAVSSAHRAEAFGVCQELVEQVKARVPIWKRQHLADGGHVWSGIS